MSVKYCNKCHYTVLVDVMACPNCNYWEFSDTKSEPEYHEEYDATITNSSWTYATAFERWLAFMIDFFILLFITCYCLFILYLIFTGNRLMLYKILLLIISSLYISLYYPIMESSSRQGTFGKNIMKLMVIDEYGDKITINLSCKRYIYKWISDLFFGLGYLFMFFNPKKQTLYDILSRTYVVKRKD